MDGSHKTSKYWGSVKMTLNKMMMKLSWKPDLYEVYTLVWTHTKRTSSVHLGNNKHRIKITKGRVNLWVYLVCIISWATLSLMPPFHPQGPNSSVPARGDTAVHPACDGGAHHPVWPRSPCRRLRQGLHCGREWQEEMRWRWDREGQGCSLYVWWPRICVCGCGCVQKEWW